jgi:glucoamylase
VIDRLVRCLVTGTDLTAEEILDVLWLSALRGAYQDQVALDRGREQPGQPESPDDSDHASTPFPEQDAAAPVLDADEARLPLRLAGGPPTAETREGTPAREAGFAAPRPIRDSLALPRALRRLRQIRTPGRRPQLDIDATVEATALADGRLIPVFTRPAERALDLALVVDGGAAMRIWDDTFDEFEQLMTQTGAFRTVSRWRLMTDGHAPVITDPSGAPHPPSRLVDPSGRRVVFVATDASGETWYAAGPWAALAEWSAAMPTALIQVLPPQYWSGTALGEPYLIARAPRPAAPNRDYDRKLAWWAQDPGGLPLPVVTLGPDTLQAWAQAAVSGTAWVPGITATPPDAGYAPSAVAAQAGAHELVDDFLARASPAAERFARILASAGTLSMPLIAVLQERLASGTGVTELAEILSSGMLLTAGPPDRPLLRFRPGVREVLQRGVTTFEEWDAYEAMTSYLEEHPVLGGKVGVLVPDPAGHAQLDPAQQPFADLHEHLATRLGLRAAAAKGDDAAQPVLAAGPVDSESPEDGGIPAMSESPVFAVTTAVLDGRLLVVAASLDGSVRAWDFGTDPPAGRVLTRQSGPVYAAACAEQAGQPLIVCGGEDGEVQVIGLRTGRVEYEFRPGGDDDDNEVTALAIVPAGRRLLVVSGWLDGMIRTFDLASGDPVGEISAHDEAVSALAAGEGAGRPLVVSVSSHDAAIKVWDLVAGEQVSVLTGSWAGVDAVAVASLSDGTLAVSAGGQDRQLHVWDLAHARQLASFDTSSSVHAVTLASVGGHDLILAGDTDGEIRTWQLASPELRAMPRGHAGGVNALATATVAGVPVAISGGVDGTVRVWDLATARQTGQAPSPGETEAAPYTLAMAADAMFPLMMRNIASETNAITDPVNAGIVSAPGCVVASPSWQNSATHMTQNYVYHWTRDAAIAALEMSRAHSAGTLPDNQPLINYVTFSQTCQQSQGDFDRACFYINGTQRQWTDQTDGPALQTLALLAMYPQLDGPTQSTAVTLVNANLDFLAGAYQGQTYNLWEEEYGYSFFARSVQLRCFQAIAANIIGITVPTWLPTALTWLTSALDSHWNGEVYQSVLPVPTDYRAPYDPNIDIVMAALYGAADPADTRLLATAGQLRSLWMDPPSKYFYPINGADQRRGIGPLLGRYPGDVYDGDTDQTIGDHPWSISTANFAEFLYLLARRILETADLPFDDLSADFFRRLGVSSDMSPEDVAVSLRTEGDRMLSALVFHSADYELSEQFDAVTGFVKGARDLTWSYAAFLSATRARARIGAISQQPARSAGRSVAE